MSYGRPGARSVAAALLTLIVLVVPAGLGIGGGAAPATTAHPAGFWITGGNASHIPLDHIVIVFQENHVYDNYFGTYCATLSPVCSVNGTGIPPGTCVPLDPTELAEGCVRPYLYAMANVTKPTDLVHSWAPAHQAYDNGSLDGFYLAEGKHLGTFGYYDGSLIPTYWDLAQQYALGDNFFGSVLSYSTPNHWYLVGGGSPAIGVNQSLHRGSNAAILTTNQSEYLNEANSTPTIEDLLNGTGVSWKYYDWALPTYETAIKGQAGAGTPDTAFDYWNPLAAKSESYTSANAAHFVASSSFFADAAAGNLPNVSWVLPAFNNSDHPASNLQNGETWVGSVVNAVEQSPEWNDTAIFVAWDDYGGYYDHQAPPQIDGRGVSFRSPFLVIGPYVRQNYISHHFEYFESLLHLIEWRFHLPSLTSRDANAPLPLEYFDFNASPRSPWRIVGPYNAVYPTAFQPLPAPPAPVDLSATPGPASITLSWTLPTNGTAVGAYQLTGGPASLPDELGLRVDGSLRTTTISNLAPGTLYQFSLVSQTANRTSVPAYVAATPLNGTTTALPAGSSTWEQLPLGSGPTPSARQGASFVYDGKDQADLLFGGESANGTFLSDSWEYLGGRWTQVLGPGPSPRAFAAASYDAKDGMVLLLGGLGSSGYLGDTWKFASGSWTNLTGSIGPTHPSARAYAATAYDSFDKYVVLFGGRNASSTLGDTWKYVSGKWTVYSSLSKSPGPRWGATMAYDGLDNYTLLYGGNTSSGSLLNETWRFLTGSWKMLTPLANPGLRMGASAGYDALDGVVLLTGGTTPTGPASGTWKFAGGFFTLLSTPVAPAPRSFGGLVFDGLRNGALLGFGQGTAGALADLYTFDPPVRIWLTASPTTGLTGTPVVFSPTVTGGLPPYSDQWLFGDGSTSTLEYPTHTYGVPGIFDAVLLVTDAVGAQSSISVRVDIDGSLAASVTATDPLPDGTTTLTATVGGGLPPYVFNWTFGDGFGAIGSNVETHRYTSVGTYPASVNVTDANGQSVGASIWITIAPPPLTADASANGTLGTFPMTVGFNGTAEGGTAPYSYSWNFGDGSKLASGANVTHTFLHKGQDVATLTVTDATSATATATVAIHVDAPMSVKFTETPVNGTAPLTVKFAPKLSGGTAPYAYAWVFGDGGTSSARNTTHKFTTAGIYTISLTVTDSLGLRLSAQGTVNVTGHPADHGAEVALVTSAGAPAAPTGPVSTGEPSPAMARRETETAPIDEGRPTRRAPRPARFA